MNSIVRPPPAALIIGGLFVYSSQPCLRDASFCIRWNSYPRLFCIFLSLLLRICDLDGRCCVVMFIYMWNDHQSINHKLSSRGSKTNVAAVVDGEEVEMKCWFVVFVRSGDPTRGREINLYSPQVWVHLHSSFRNEFLEDYKNFSKICICGSSIANNCDSP